MKIFTPLLLLLPILIIACGAKGPEGKWTGKVSIDETQLDEAAKKQAKLFAGMLENMTISLELKADKTASVATSGGLGSSSSTGTWTSEGKSVTFTPKTGKVLAMTVSDDGKTMTAADPSTKGVVRTFHRDAAK